jgi:hypothetical protein
MRIKKESPRRGNKQGKDNQFINQQQRVLKAFGQRPKTMLEVSIETGVLRANICRFIADWQREGRIQLWYKGYCSISKHRAGFYHTVKRGGQSW